MKKSWYITAAIMLSMIGFAVIGWGASSKDNPLRSMLMLSLGGALFGAGISQIIAAFIGFDFMASLARALEPGFSTDEEKIENYRDSFHHYHLTEMNGGFIWRYAVIDFRKNNDIGKLSTITEYIGINGSKTNYKVNAGFRDERFILFLKAQKRDEPAIVEVFPFLGKEIKENHCGVIITESWDETHLISRCIISRTPILNWKTLGTISKDIAEKLDEMWVNGIKHNYSPITLGAEHCNNDTNVANQPTQ